MSIMPFPIEFCGELLFSLLLCFKTYCVLSFVVEFCELLLRFLFCHWVFCSFRICTINTSTNKNVCVYFGANVQLFHINYILGSLEINSSTLDKSNNTANGQKAWFCSPLSLSDLNGFDQLKMCLSSQRQDQSSTASLLLDTDQRSQIKPASKVT